MKARINILVTSLYSEDDRDVSNVVHGPALVATTFMIKLRQSGLEKGPLESTGVHMNYVGVVL